jgi:hypothetical protein
MHQEPRFGFLIATLVVGLISFAFILAYIPWAPGFPITANLVAVPGIFVMRAPQHAIVQSIEVNKASLIPLGKSLIHLVYLQQLTQNSGQNTVLKQLNAQLIRLNVILKRQERLCLRYQDLATKKLISVMELLQKKEELRRLFQEKETLISKIAALKLKMGVDLKMPYAGMLAQQLVTKGQLVKPKQPLLILKPKINHYELKVALPLAYYKYVRIHQILKLNFIQAQKIKRYPITARVTAIYPRVSQPNNTISLKAHIEHMPALNQLEDLSHIPLEGFLLGERQPLYLWVFQMIFGGENHDAN